MNEPVLEPGLPIVDAHFHFWLYSEAILALVDKGTTLSARAMAPVLRRQPRYLLDEHLADLNTGHNIRATVHVDAQAMYRAGGPAQLKSVGEVEFVNGAAAMSASGSFGDIRVCAGIVGGGVDLTLGDAVEPILAAHIAAGGGRYKGLRSWPIWDADATISAFGHPHVLLDQEFRRGFRHLAPLGLSFDSFMLEPQLPDVIDLARAFPDTQIIVNHLGCPIGVGQYTGKRLQRFPIWRDNMLALSRCANVAVKLGGVGSHFSGFDYGKAGTITSDRLAADWRPYIETCIEAFGVSRCMFESNFPVDAAAASYPVVWNAFKRITRNATPTEKSALYSGTAIRIYRLDLGV